MIVLVDDDDALLSATQMFLEHLGFGVRVGRNGHDALAAVRQRPPRYVVMDVNMPEMNGLEALDRIHAEHPDLPVVLITGQPDFDGLEERVDGKRVRLLVKPFPLADLAALIR